MLPKYHILISFVVSYILIFFCHFSLFAGLIIFLSSFLIDIDHYFIYLMKHQYNLLEDYKTHIKLADKYMNLSLKQREKYKKNIIIFHGLEFILLLIILSFFSRFFLWLLIGTLIHLSIDFIDLLTKKEPLYSKISQIYTFIKNKNKKTFN